MIERFTNQQYYICDFMESEKEDIPPNEYIGKYPKPIDWDKVDKLILSQNNGVEVAAQFNMHPDTFYRKLRVKSGLTFSAYAASLYSKGVSNLKAKRYDMAMNGNVAMINRLSDVYVDKDIKQQEAEIDINDIQNEKMEYKALLKLHGIHHKRQAEPELSGSSETI